MEHEGGITHSIYRNRRMVCLLLSISVSFGIFRLLSTVDGVNDLASIMQIGLRQNKSNDPPLKVRGNESDNIGTHIVGQRLDGDSALARDLRELQELQIKQESRAATATTNSYVTRKSFPSNLFRSKRGNGKEGEVALPWRGGVCSNGVSCPDIVSLARSKGLEKGGTLPLVFVNTQYWLILLNNFAAMAKVDRALPAQIGVVCLDEGVVKQLAELGAPPCYLLSDDDGSGHGDKNIHATKTAAFPGNNSSSSSSSSSLRSSLLSANGDGAAMTELWQRRVVEINRLLSAGFGALCFDVDAVWKSDARSLLGITRPSLSAAPRVTSTAAAADTDTDGSDSVGSWSYKYDVVASRGSFPNPIVKKWGATLCMGFIYFAPTKGARRLVSHMFASIDKAKKIKAEAALRGKQDPGFDDQISINQALAFGAHLTWGQTDRVETNSSNSSRNRTTSGVKGGEPPSRRRNLVGKRRQLSALASQRSMHGVVNAKQREFSNVTGGEWRRRYLGRRLRVRARRRPVLSPSAPVDQTKVSTMQRSYVVGGRGGGGTMLGYVGSRQVDVGRGSLGDVEVAVALLPHSLVPRRCDKVDKVSLKHAAVLHCYSHKTARGKIEAGRRYGSWVLAVDITNASSPHHPPSLKHPPPPPPAAAASLSTLSGKGITAVVIGGSEDRGGSSAEAASALLLRSEHFLEWLQTLSQSKP